MTSPVAGFIEDCCEAIDPECGVGVWLEELHEEYQRWARQQGHDHLMVRQVFAKNLRSAGNGRIRVDRKRVDGIQRYVVFGLALIEPTPMGLRLVG